MNIKDVLDTNQTWDLSLHVAYQIDRKVVNHLMDSIYWELYNIICIENYLLEAVVMI